MAVTCREIIQLPSLHRIELVAGKEGLDREVSWPYIGENIIISPWVRGGELMFITGIGMERDEKSLLTLLKECNEQNLSGLVVSLNKDYIGEITPAMSELADQLKFPLFTLPWEVRRLDVSKEISMYLVKHQIERQKSEQLFELLLKGNLTIEEEEQLRQIYESSSMLINYFYIGMICRMEAEDENEWELNAAGIVKKMQSKFYMFQEVHILKYPYIYFVLQIQDEKKDIPVLSHFVRRHLSRENSDIKVAVGSVVQRDEISVSLSQADAAQKIADKDFVSYDELGFQRVVYAHSMDGENINYCKSTLKKILEYDENNEGELLKTIIAYVENLFNISQTAQCLFIHRNSLMYRLNKIEELTEKNMKNPYDIMDLAYCAMCMMRFMKNV